MPTVENIPTSFTRASIGSRIWMDREYTIKHLPNRLEGTILIQPNYIVNHKDKSIDIVVKNKETYVFLAIYQKDFDSHRTEMNDGGLPRVLGTQGWEQLTNP